MTWVTVNNCGHTIWWLCSTESPYKMLKAFRPTCTVQCHCYFIVLQYRHRATALYFRPRYMTADWFLGQSKNRKYGYAWHCEHVICKLSLYGGLFHSYIVYMLSVVWLDNYIELVASFTTCNYIVNSHLLHQSGLKSF